MVLKCHLWRDVLCNGFLSTGFWWNSRQLEERSRRTPCVRWNSSDTCRQWTSSSSHVNASSLSSSSTTSSRRFWRWCKLDHTLYCMPICIIFHSSLIAVLLRKQITTLFVQYRRTDAVLVENNPDVLFNSVTQFISVRGLLPAWSFVNFRLSRGCHMHAVEQKWGRTTAFSYMLSFFSSALLEKLHWLSVEWRVRCKTAT